MKNSNDLAQVLVINAGSSSIKFSLVNPVSGDHEINGGVDRLGTDQAVLAWTIDGEDHEKLLGKVDLSDALAAILVVLRMKLGADWSPSAMGHRMVHGAEYFKSSVRVDDDALEKLTRCIPMAPLHNPANLDCIREAIKLFPECPQVAVMDTAFHQTMPPRAFLYPIPYELYEDHGIRRYGFHGTSHRYVSEIAAERLGKPLTECAIITAHLGNGCSAAAVLNGECQDTTMGLTPLEGLVMGTRSGDVDPSLHQFLADNLSMSLDDITSMLNKKSGLLGLSGVSNDMRELIQKANDGHDRARLAVEVFCYRLAKHLAALVVPLGRLDALVFTGGIGTYSAPVRERVVHLLGFLGLDLDPDTNSTHGTTSNGCITRGSGPVALVIKTDEEGMIAKETWETLFGDASS